MSTFENRAVVARRHEPPNSLDFFPTPPWATRALVNDVLMRRHMLQRHHNIWEPACGEGHMAATLQEFSDHPVIATDVFDYGYGVVDDFIHGSRPISTDWIITNPPFKAALDFAWEAMRAPLRRARRGVALLVRLQWLETKDRYLLFSAIPPTLIAISTERIPMHRGRWLPDGSTATAYAWVIWLAGEGRWPDVPTTWIPPGRKQRYTRPDDAARFGAIDPLMIEAPMSEASVSEAMVVR